MNIYIHIGYPKTGSTFLQKVIFPKISTMDILDKDNPELRRNIFKNIITLDDFEYNKKKNYLLNIVENELKKINKTNEIILSWEGFLNPFNYHDKYKIHGNNVERTILRLNDLFSKFGNVNLILIIRKYDDLIESFFNQVYHLIEFDFDKYDLIDTLSKKSEKFNFIFEAFLYSKLINFLLKNEINNSVLVYEDLKYDKNKFFQDLSLALNCSEINSYIHLSDEFKNSRKEKNSFKYKLNYLINIFPSLKNLIKNIFNRHRYEVKFKKIYQTVIKRKSNIQKSDYDYLISKFFYKDYESLPKEIKLICKKYKYLGTE